ncbi:hypothetical protein ACFQS1_20395 [Paractinoplanes rhizophilus]|uniref:Uncharacterized protein n=1 Tax=Paractinoplanes rhizophilus TaxID=1416877 RepID=A0ABW2HV71_9ACTN
MRIRPVLAATLLSVLTAGTLSGCHSASGAAEAPSFVDSAAPSAPSPDLSAGPSASVPASASPSTPASASATPPVKPKTLPKPGNPNGHAAVPSTARPVDTSKPTRKIGNGTAASCTSAAVVKAVAAGGIITFDCGPVPVTITMTATAKVRNTVSKVVLDGGGRVTLDGAGKRRILYLNTCDAKQGNAGGSCIERTTPKLVVQNMAFKNGNSTGEKLNEGGGGAIFAYGGSLRVINSRFTGNKCDRTGPDLGGGAVRISYQGGDNTVYVVGSTFTGGSCSNGAALSSLHARWVVLNSVLSGNSAVGNGANPARAGTPGGGSGGAIYMDGDTIKLTVDGTIIEKNHAKEGGGAIFFVSNDRSGTLTIRNSKLRKNPSDGFETFPGVFYLGKGDPVISGSTVS